MKLFALVMLLAFASIARAQAAVPSQTRAYLDFDPDWRFIKGDFGNAMMPAFVDASWRVLDLPHDWSIEGPFAPEYAAGTGFAPGGIAWYRKHFKIDPAYKGKLISIEFDGVYCNSQVYINGFVVGGRPYGYSSFQCDLTSYVKFDAENVIGVRVDHSKFADSRWYPGSGIYRNVRLCITDKLRIGHDGIYLTTPIVNDSSATVRVEASLENSSGRARSLSLQSEVIAPDGRSVGSISTTGDVGDSSKKSVTQQMAVDRPQLWSPESPSLYQLRTRLVADNVTVDEVTTPFGIRSIEFNPDKGFLLNGKQVKLKGVCIHHDAGCLGAAVPEKVLERRLKILKEIGVNAIRTSHNPPAPELLELCDRMGFLVKDEAFDEFTPAKNKWIAGWNVGEPGRWGYADIFNQWAITDIQDMVRRDRNHPSIIMWSIGNEVDYQNDPFSDPVLGNNYRPTNPPATDLARLGRPLVEAVKKLDTTRPVTAALANVPMSNAAGFADILDVVGYNYQELLYPTDHQKYPKRVIFGSENHHDYGAWLAVRDNDYVCGQFLWTGIDYLGEAGRWPSRGNNAGLLDTCGFKKPLAWFRQSLWSEKPMVYICTSGAGGGRRGGGRGGQDESWNRQAGTNTTITCYTNCQEVQLSLNDKSIGGKRNTEAVNGVLSWSIPFDAGMLKAVGLIDGKAESEYVLKTAGPPARIELVADQTELRNDGKDISHIEFRITDAQGIRVPDATNEVKFQIDGPVRLLGIDNGLMSGQEDYKSPSRQAARGRGLAILQSTRTAGRSAISVWAEGLQPATLVLTSR